MDGIHNGVTFLPGCGMGKVELAYLFLHSLCNAVQRYEGERQKRKEKKGLKIPSRFLA